MHKAFRHTGVLMMVAVVALGLLGAAYTMWYENLTLNATVTTGTVDVNWSIDLVHPEDGNWTSDELVKADGFTTGDWFHLNLRTPRDGGIPGVTEPPLDKYLQECSISQSNQTNEPANPSQHTLTINALGLYPYAGCEFAFDIENTGTVPVHLTQQVAKTVTTLPAGAVVHLVTGGVTVTQSANVPAAEAEAVCTAVLNNWLYAAANPIGEPLTWMDGTTSRVIQLHQGAEVNCRVWFYLAQDSTEGASINIVSTLIAHQWNENVP